MKKLVLIVGDKDSSEKWNPFAKSFERKGYDVLLLYYYWNKKNAEQKDFGGSIKQIILTQAAVMDGSVTDADVDAAEKELGIDSMRNFVFTECVLYEKDYKFTVYETVDLLGQVKRAVDFSKVSFILQNQGAGLLRRICYHLGLKHSVPSVYFDVSWFPGRMFLQSNEMNILDEFSPRDIKECTTDIIKKLEDFAAEKREKKSTYQYAFVGPKISVLRRAAAKIRKMPEKNFRKSALYRFKRLKRKMRAVFINIIFDKMNGMKLPEDTPFFFFPLHYPKDSQITLRNQQYVHQDVLIEYLSWNMPHGMRLVVKPHPQAKGDYTYRELHAIRSLDNCVLLSAGYSTHDILRNPGCRGVITLNSSVGFECLLYNKPVIALSDFYGIEYRPCVYRIQPKDFAATVRAAGAQKNREEDYLAALYSIYAAAYPGGFFVQDIDYETVVDAVIKKAGAAKKSRNTLAGC